MATHDTLGFNAGCCEVHHGCVFAKALLARTASCGLSERRAIGERDRVDCTSPVARLDCGTFAALLHERSRFALKLPSPSRPLTHVQSLRLQCGGLAALRQELACDEADVHRMVGGAMERHGSLADLPWASLVAALAAWQPRRRARPKA